MNHVVDFSPVQARLETAKAIAWDGCHKIYVVMDDVELGKMIGYGYEPITKDQKDAEQMFATILEWFADSCDLVFIDAVSTNKENPNAGFETLIGQFFGEDE